MAKRTAKPAKKAAPAREDTIFDHFARQGIGDQLETVEKVAGGTKNVTNEQLQARIDALDKQVEQAQRENRALMAAPLVTAARAAPEKAPGVDLKGLPDPITEPEAYEKGLNERISAGINAGIETFARNQAAAGQEHGSQQAKIDGLWTDFQAKYEEFDGLEDRVEFAATKVV